MPTVFLEFRAARGCPLGVLEDMARYDGARVLRAVSDLRCEAGAVRSAALDLPRGRSVTMARWASFMLGARIIPPPAPAAMEAALMPSGPPPGPQPPPAPEAAQEPPEAGA